VTLFYFHIKALSSLASSSVPRRTIKYACACPPTRRVASSSPPWFHLWS